MKEKIEALIVKRIKEREAFLEEGNRQLAIYGAVINELEALLAPEPLAPVAELPAELPAEPKA